MAVGYIGSPYHKRYPTESGGPGLRSDKTECPTEIALSEARDVLIAGIEESIAAGRCSRENAGDWPRLVWGRGVFRSERGSLEVVWEARLSNRATGEYHAYPIQPDRHDGAMPPEVKEELWPEE